MGFIITYDGQEFPTDLALEGHLTLTSEPFTLEYCIQESSEENSRRGLMEKTETIRYKAESDKPLEEIDGLYAEHMGSLKVEIKKGELYLNGRSINDYMGEGEFETPIRLRGHHLVGIIENFEAMEKNENWEEELRQGLESGGFDPRAIDTYIGITRYLRQHPETEFIVVEDLDGICEDCKAAKDCKGVPEILQKDLGCLARLGLEAGKRYRAQNLIERMYTLDSQ